MPASTRFDPKVVLSIGQDSAQNGVWILKDKTLVICLVHFGGGALGLELRVLGGVGALEQEVLLSCGFLVLLVST